MPDGIDMAMDAMKERLAEIKAKLSQCRKKGFEVKIAEIKAAEIPAKINLLKATRDMKEISKINMMLDYADAEIAEAERRGEEEKVEKQHDKDVEFIIETCDAGIEEIKYHNINKAKECYANALGKYSNLPDKRKKEVRDQMEKLRSKLS
jgi:hypothetical protein